MTDSTVEEATVGFTIKYWRHNGILSTGMCFYKRAPPILLSLLMMGPYL